MSRWLRVLVGVTTLLAIVGMFAVWANRLLFNPDKFAETSAQLLADENVRTATSSYLVDQLYAATDPAAKLREGLPPRLAPLAAPAAGALRNGAERAINLALQRPRVQSLWKNASRAADATFVAIVEGGNGNVTHENGVVTLNLSGVLNDVAQRLGIEADVGSKLPDNVANLQILKSDQLGLVQDIGNIVKGLALWLTILVVLLYALAIFLAHQARRRMLRFVGFSMIFAGIVGVGIRALLTGTVVDSLAADEAVKPAVRSVLEILTQIYGDIAHAFIFVGVAFVIAAWLAGQTRLAVALRQALAPTMRLRPGMVYGTAAALVVLLLVWQPIHATTTLAGIIAIVVLAALGTEALRRPTVREFPDAQPGEATAALRAWWAERRGGGAVPAAGVSTELEKLASLKDRGAISEAEYDAAKARLLPV